MLHRVLVLCALMLTPTAGIAQQDETLADIRQQLTVLYVDVQRLKRELSTTGGLNSGVAGATPLDRLNAIEAELQRLLAMDERARRVSSSVRHVRERILTLRCPNPAWPPCWSSVPWHAPVPVAAREQGRRASW